MDFNPRFWHRRFTQQAGWTSEVRRYILQTLRIPAHASILEVGCGTGAVLSHIYREGFHHVYGADIAFSGLQYARSRAPHRRLSCADGLSLPFYDKCFTVSLCHYLLLWATDPLGILQEMKRVTCDGGFLVVLAEPDYAQRKDEPPALRKLGELQNMALLSMGAHLSIGSQLQDLFEQLNLADIKVNMLKPATPLPSNKQEDSLEWQVIEYDLRQLVKQGHLSEDQVEQFHQLDAEARQEGKRLLHIPTYFGWAQVV